MKEQILVTGSSGFIGQALLKRLLNDGYPPFNIIAHYNHNKPQIDLESFLDINLYQGDLTNKSHVHTIFSLYPNISKIIHCAAIASPSSTDANLMFDLNVKSTQYLLECSTQSLSNGVPIDVTFLSSIMVYPKYGYFIETDALKPHNLYGITKVTAEMLLDLYYMEGKIRPRILRLSGVVGGGMTHGAIANAKFHYLNKTTMTMRGKYPGVYLPLTHINDVVNAIKRTTFNYNKPTGTFNVSAPDTIGLGSALKILYPGLSLIWDEANEPASFGMCNKKAKVELQWIPQYNSEQAIHQMRREIIESGELHNEQ